MLSSGIEPWHAGRPGDVSRDADGAQMVGIDVALPLPSAGDDAFEGASPGTNAPGDDGGGTSRMGVGMGSPSGSARATHALHLGVVLARPELQDAPRRYRGFI